MKNNFRNIDPSNKNGDFLLGVEEKIPLWDKNEKIDNKNYDKLIHIYKKIGFEITNDIKEEDTVFMKISFLGRLGETTNK